MDAPFSPLGRTDPHTRLRSSEVPGCRYEFPDRTQRRRLGLVRFGCDDRGEFGFVTFHVRGEHAERVAPRDELADLAGPWAEAISSLRADDLVGFLNDLQHLSRHAKATGGSVYALEAF